MTRNTTDDEYIQLTKRLVEVGERRMLDRLQQFLDEMRAGFAPVEEPKRRIGRPRKDRQPVVSAGRSAWSGMSKEERSAEMIRRQAVARANKKARSVAENMSRAAKKRWANMTVREQREKLAKMRAGKSKPNGTAVPTVQMEKAS